MTIDELRSVCDVFDRFSVDTESNGRGSQHKLEKPESGTQSTFIKNRYLQIIRKIRLSRSGAASAVSSSSIGSASATQDDSTGSSRFVCLESLPLASSSGGGTGGREGGGITSSGIPGGSEAFQMRNSISQYTKEAGSRDEKASLLYIDAASNEECTDEFRHPSKSVLDRISDRLLPHSELTTTCPQSEGFPAQPPAVEQTSLLHHVRERLSTGSSHVAGGEAASASGGRPETRSAFGSVDWNRVVRERILKRRLQLVQEELKSQGQAELKISSI